MREEQTEHISATVEHEVGVISINRPQYRNALSKGMWLAIPDLQAECLRQGARVIVIQGEGGAFAAGADFADMQKLNSRKAIEELWGAIRTALNTVADCAVPTIAKIVGPCMGGGCLLAVACDMRFGEPGARFSVPVAQLGITLDEGNIDRLVCLVGRGVAAELLFTGAVFNAARAEESGLINAMVPALELSSVVSGITEQIRACSADSVKHLKRTLLSVCHNGRSEEDQSAVIDSYLSAEFRSRIKKAGAKS